MAKVNKKPSIAERRKTVDTDKLPLETMDEIALDLGKRIGALAQDAENKANEIAKIYGLKVRMTLCFVDKNGNPIQG